MIDLRVLREHWTDDGVHCRKQLNSLSDDMAAKIDVQFYSDARDALLKAVVESAVMTSEGRPIGVDG